MDNEQPTTKLLLTVSGGLEELAEKQLRSCFKQLSQLSWKKGPSGSQVYLSLPFHTTIASEIAEAVNHLDFVEYAFVQLESLYICSDNTGNEGNIPVLLKQLEQATTRTKRTSVDLCKTICESFAGDPSCAVGLERLPGILLRTPDISSLSTTPSASVAFDDFAVNTVYTQSNVAQAVVETICEFCNEYYPFCHEKDTLWLDAGSGNGALLDHLPTKNSVGVDTHPMSSRVLKMDFLKLTRIFLKKKFPEYKHLFVISNPPFSLSSRGDYTPIVQFINHSLDALNAQIVAVICPSKFARKRIWRSLDITDNAQLLGRFFLPENAFLNPSTGQTIHIHSYCLIFGKTGTTSHNETELRIAPKTGVYVSAKRDKGCFPNLCTADLTMAIVAGLTKVGMELVAERKARYMLHAKLVDSSLLELWWHLNPHRPCSLVNSSSIQVPNHSLGWLSVSCKPAIALAMSSIALSKEKEEDGKKCRVAVNLMSGEGTIELEASRAVPHSFFLLSGDKSFGRALKTTQRIQYLKTHSHHCPIVDVVVWDAQNLPLRRGIADAVLADLPFQGSLQKVHQEPVVGTTRKTTQQPLSLNYSQVLLHACRILKSKGQAALLSPDFKALQHASGGFNWSPLGYSRSINVGGLSGKLFLMERREACSKDVSMWVPSTASDLSACILDMANKACNSEASEELERLSIQTPLVTSVHLHSTYYHTHKQSFTHCYRIQFADQIRNVYAKQLEQQIRGRLMEEKMLEGMSLR